MTNKEDKYHSDQNSMNSLFDGTNSFGDLGSKAILIFLAIVVGFSWTALFSVSKVRAADSKGDDEYNFSWLDPDKKIYVLQNRKYLKGGHAVLTAMGGIGFSNPYRNAYNFDPRFTYYINETWGVDLFYTMTFNSSNNTLQALTQAAPNTLPAIREIRAQYGGMVQYVPWYAKINVFNSILYFDWYFAGGAGMINSFVNTQTQASATATYVEDDLLGIFLGTGHMYHISQNFLVRVDVTTAIYQAHINGLTGDTAWYSNLNFGVGICWKL